MRPKTCPDARNRFPITRGYSFCAAKLRLPLQLSKKNFRNSLSIPDLLTVYLCYLSDCHCFTTYKFGCFLESPRAKLFRVLASCCARAMYCVPDEPLFRCRRDFFGKELGGSEILRTFAVHCPKKPRSSRLPKIDAIGRRKGGRHIGYGIRYA